VLEAIESSGEPEVTGIEDVEYLECPLTAPAQPVAEMCARAWQFLQQRLEGPSRPVQWTVLKPALAIRESYGRLAAWKHGTGNAADSYPVDCRVIKALTPGFRAALFCKTRMILAMSELF